MMKTGERIRIYSCCSKTTSEEEGCVRGPHVFYETKPEELHARHAFSHTRPYVDDTADPALNVVALDCEMIYTTAGMSVARVSVVDGSGQEVYDQFVRLDDSVEVMCVFLEEILSVCLSWPQIATTILASLA